MRFRKEGVTEPSTQTSRLVTPIKVETNAGGVKATGRVLVDNPERTAVQSMFVTARREVPTRRTRSTGAYTGNTIGTYEQPVRDRMGLRKRTTRITYQPDPVGSGSDRLFVTYSVTGRGRIQNVLGKEAGRLDRRIQ